MAALIYLIWEQRNKKVWKIEEIKGDDMLRKVRACVKNRVLIERKISVQDEV